ncbi:MAG: SUMF1/EgtB/PvdO family nonheme iron enzyme [Microcoleaceae cyanobacterium MO_207.B10]|nr:SUMF1/EgtB/PvdO family nonheme iron enzyme [Microcoleaceae cyanobacterium MO_207.B10]
MEQCRQNTLKLFADMDYATFSAQPDSEFSPVGWHLGHIAYTEALWLLEKSAGMSPLFPENRKFWAADGLPKAQRRKLPQLADILDYLEIVRNKVFDYLEVSPLEEQERFWWFILQHESQHCETITFVLELQKLINNHKNAHLSSNQTISHIPQPMIEIPGGEFQIGSNAIYAMDNERSPHHLQLDTFWLDAYPVTRAQYGEFMAAGGYENSQWWSDGGWEWLQTNLVKQPLYWSDDAIFEYHPVCGVSWYEAEAYCNFVGKRLPTEAEWEKAASWDMTTLSKRSYPWGETEADSNRCNCDRHFGETTAVGSFPTGVSAYGCHDMLGNVWEWTNSWFDGYEGFQYFPYRGYSQTYFDGKHRVLKGGSWATYRWGMRCSFRNWYYPNIRQIFAGFRCASSAKM